MYKQKRRRMWIFEKMRARSIKSWWRGDFFMWKLNWEKTIDGNNDRKIYYKRGEYNDDLNNSDPNEVETRFFMWKPISKENHP